MFCWCSCEDSPLLPFYPRCSFHVCAVRFFDWAMVVDAFQWIHGQEAIEPWLKCHKLSYQFITAHVLEPASSLLCKEFFLIDWSAPQGKMLRLTGRCGAPEHCQWSDWHGTATRKQSARRQPLGDLDKRLLMFLGTLFAFYFEFSRRAVMFHCRVCHGSFQGRGSKAFKKTANLFKPATSDYWQDGARCLRHLFSRPSMSQEPVNMVYPENMKDIKECFGADALADRRINQRRSKKEDLATWRLQQPRPKQWLRRRQQLSPHQRLTPLATSLWA